MQDYGYYLAFRTHLIQKRIVTGRYENFGDKVQASLVPVALSLRSFR
jgi:hypothetical protein